MIFGKHSLHSTGLNLIDSTTFNNDADLDQTAAILYSSGTTSIPKGVMHSHRTIIGLSQILVPNRFYEPHILPTTNDFQDVNSSFLPFFHVYELTITLLNRLLLGCKVLSMKYEINHFLDSIVRHKATILPLIPPVIIQFNNHPNTSSNHFQYARNIMYGAASLADGDVKRLLKLFVLYWKVFIYKLQKSKINLRTVFFFSLISLRKTVISFKHTASQKVSFR